MRKWIKLLCFYGGNVMYNEEGCYYDREHEAIIKLPIEASYSYLQEVLANELEVDISQISLEISHRNLCSVYGRDIFLLVPIKTNADVSGLIGVALSSGSIRQHIYIGTSTVMGDSQFSHVRNEGPREAVVALREAAPIDPEEPSFHGDAWVERIAESSGTDSDDDFDDGEDVPEEAVIVSEAGGDAAVANYEEPVPFFVQAGGDGAITFEEEIRQYIGGSSSADDFVVGMRFETKEDLQKAVKIHHVQSHHRFRVKKSDKEFWKAVCFDRSCEWKLCACIRKNDRMFQITKYVGPHTCINPTLSQDHPHLDSNVMAVHFRQYVRADPDVKVSFLRTVICDKYHYDVPSRRVWDGHGRF